MFWCLGVEVWEIVVMVENGLDKLFEYFIDWLGVVCIKLIVVLMISICNFGLENSLIVFRIDLYGVFICF